MKGTIAIPLKIEYPRARHRLPSRLSMSAGGSPQVLRNSSPEASEELGLVPPVPLSGEAGVDGGGVDGSTEEAILQTTESWLPIPSSAVN